MNPRPERLLAMLLVLLVAAAFVVVIAVMTSGSPGTDAPPSADRTLPPDTVAATVVGVTDGDTVQVEVDGTRERVRYIGVDAPELARPTEARPAECGADAAREANRVLVDGAEVRLERDTTDRDRFGRLLRHVWVRGSQGWAMVGAELVRAGAVEARSFPPDTARDGELDALERAARDLGAGIWGSC